MDIPTLKVLVAGDQGIGKKNFINSFLYSYPSSADFQRKSDTMYFMYKPGEVKIHLYDTSSIESLDRNSYDMMDIVFFCYTANEPESLRSLEKLMTRIYAKKVAYSATTKKEVHSFLVADLSNVGNQHDVAKKAIELKEDFGIKRFIENAFQDKESSASVFRTILSEIIPPKLNENSLDELCKESLEKCFKTLSPKRVPYELPNSFLYEASSLGYSNLSEEFENNLSFEDFLFGKNVNVSKESQSYFSFKSADKLKNDNFKHLDVPFRSDYCPFYERNT